MNEKPEPKFKVGQVVVMTCVKQEHPFRIVSIEWADGWFYGWNSEESVSESMIRKLTAEEVG